MIASVGDVCYFPSQTYLTHSSLSHNRSILYFLLSGQVWAFIKSASYLDARGYWVLRKERILWSSSTRVNRFIGHQMLEWTDLLIIKSLSDRVNMIFDCKSPLCSQLLYVNTLFSNSTTIILTTSLRYGPNFNLTTFKVVTQKILLLNHSCHFSHGRSVSFFYLFYQYLRKFIDDVWYMNEWIDMWLHKVKLHNVIRICQNQTESAIF